MVVVVVGNCSGGGVVVVVLVNDMVVVDVAVVVVMQMDMVVANCNLYCYQPSQVLISHARSTSCKKYRQIAVTTGGIIT